MRSMALSVSEVCRKKTPTHGPGSSARVKGVNQGPGQGRWTLIYNYCTGFMIMCQLFRRFFQDFSYFER